MHKHIHIIMILLLLAATTGCATIAGVEEEPQPRPITSEFPYDRYVEGKPSMDFRAQGGFYLWKEGNNWHVRAAEKLDRPRIPSTFWPVMTGQISIEHAIISDLKRVSLPPADYVRQKRKEISFRFEFQDPYYNARGFDFTVRPTSLDYCVTLDFLVDGVARPGIVHLGSFMHVPDTLPIRICPRSFN